MPSMLLNGNEVLAVDLGSADCEEPNAQAVRNGVSWIRVRLAAGYRIIRGKDLVVNGLGGVRH